MSLATPLSSQRVSLAFQTSLSDYLELTKPRIAVMVLITVAVAALAAVGGTPEAWTLISAVVGTGFVATSATTWNQWWERDDDRRMARTCKRPLASGRMSSREALTFGTSLLLGGLTLLVLGTRPIAAGLALATWCIYVVIYTPMKRVSSWNTAVGAVSGAMPVLIGWTAMGGNLDLRPASLFLIVFFWQFPHFMAIAWRYRHEYSAADMRMLTVVDATGRRAGAQAVVGAASLLPTSLLLFVTWPVSLPLMALGLSLSLWYLILAFHFLIRRDDATAGRLLKGSLIYLPCIFLAYTLQLWV
jgi:protoheme IX farnesyltransferase